MPPTPNKAIRKDKGGLFLHNKQIYHDRGQHCWRYKNDNTEVPEEEFWIPQMANRPPDCTFLHKATNTYYHKKNKTWFNKCYDCWLKETEDKLCFIDNKSFLSLYLIPGRFEENLPDSLRPYSSPVDTLRVTLSKLTTASSKKETYRAETESESEPSDKEPDQQLLDSSDLVEHSVLSPLAGLSLSRQGESITVDQPGSPRSPDPFKEELSENKGEPTNVDPPDIKPNPPPNPPEGPPTMATSSAPTNLLGTCPSFKGKQKNDKEFITNIELYIFQYEQEQNQY